MKVQYCETLSLATMAIALSLVIGTALAHIKNEASQFPDIEFSEARFDIVVLVGAGIIPETPVFEPDRPLSKRELAAWIALARDLGPGGETPDTDALAQAARDQGIVDSLQGEATYADLNELFLAGAATVEAPEETPTKAEAARFLASQLDTAAGRALLAGRGMQPGNTGEIVAVEVGQGAHGNVYLITVGDVRRPMHEHGRVANGPTDLLQWNGRRVRRSFVSGEGDAAVWAYLEAEPLAAPAGDVATPAHTGAGAAAHASDRAVLYWLIAGVLVLGLILFVRRRRAG